MTPTVAGRRRHLAWGVFDQVLSSVANFLVVVLAARSLGADDFGAFALTFEVYVISVFVSRGLGSDPLATRLAGADDAVLRVAARAGATTALMTGTLVGLITLAVSFAVPDPLDGALFALAFVLPGLTLQDYLRYVLIVQSNARGTFFNDLLWGILQVPAVLVAAEINGSAGALVLGWGLAGTVAAVAGSIQSGVVPAPFSAVRTWLVEHRDLWPYYLGDNLVFQATNLVLVVVITVSTGLADVAGFRVAMTMYAPITVVGRGLLSVAVPELARRRDEPDRVVRTSLILAWALTAFTLVYAAATLLIPDGLGETAFGDSWDEGGPLVFLAGFTAAAGMYAIGASAGMRALGAGRQGLWARVVVSLASLAFAMVGGLLGGAKGVFIALAISSPLQLLVWTWLLAHGAKEAKRSRGL